MTWTSDFLNCKGGHGVMPNHLQDLYRLATLHNRRYYGLLFKRLSVIEEYNNWYLIRVDLHDNHYGARSDYYVLAPGATVRVASKDDFTLKDPGIVKLINRLTSV